MQHSQSVSAQRAMETKIALHKADFYKIQALLAVYVAVYLWWVSYKEVDHFFGMVPARIHADVTVNFNLHTACMSLSFVVFMSEALLMMPFRDLFPVHQLTFKYMHVLFHTLALISATLGIIFAIWNHQDRAMPHMNSAHAWSGAYALSICITVQYIGGAWTFLRTKASGSSRKRMLPIHQYAGLLGYALGMTTCIMGLLEKQQFVALAELGYKPSTYFVPATLTHINLPIGLPLVLAGLVMLIAMAVIRQLKFMQPHYMLP